MTDVDREQLRRDCADALEAQLSEQRVDGLAELAESLRTLGPPYRAREAGSGNGPVTELLEETHGSLL